MAKRMNLSNGADDTNAKYRFQFNPKITPKAILLIIASYKLKTHALAICELAQNMQVWCVWLQLSTHANQLQDELLFFGMQCLSATSVGDIGIRFNLTT